MSRIGKQPVAVVPGVSVSPSKHGGGTRIDVQGPKGKLQSDFRPEVSIEVDGDKVVIQRKDDESFSRAYHGTARALIANMVRGVSEGFSKRLDIIGVGYNAKIQGSKVVLAIGFCHPVELDVPKGVTVECPSPTTIAVSGPDKQVVGEFTAQIRRVRPPEPYKGKGIRYHDEHVARKQGKAFASGE